MTISMDEIDTDFYLAYGRAMASWAESERALCMIFMRITRLSQPMAWSVFYSARSLQGRIDMVTAIIPYARTVPAGRAFLSDVTRLVNSWSAARNRFAHDPHALHVEGYDPREPPTVTRIITSMRSAAPVELAHLENAAVNFGFLAMLVSISFGAQRLLRDAELSSAVLTLLPNDPVGVRIDLDRANPLAQQIGQLPH